MSKSAVNMKNNIRNEFLSVEKGDGWNSFFNAIKDECSQMYNYSSFEAKKSINKDLNRYRDVYPYDHSRIVLSKGTTDYINASLVVVDKAKRKYILTQGPLPQTTSHFWLMIWEQNCRAIVMLNRIIEKNMVKCHQYWPSEETCGDNKSFSFSDVNLKVTNISETNDLNFKTTKLSLEELETGKQKEVIHYHYTTWPDFGVPHSPTAFLRFLHTVRSSGVLENEGPTVVHCSAGIGRSGTFCLVDSCLVMIQDMQLPDIVVKDILVDMRKYRIGLIQTPGQLRFSYLAILKGVEFKVELENGMSNDDTEEINEESEEEAPPLPPPRNESLIRSQTVLNKSTEEVNQKDEQKPKRHHEKSSRGGRSSTAKRRKSYNAENRYQPWKHRDRGRWEKISSSPRHRTDREERQQILKNKVKEMKKKLRESESWRKWKNSIFHPWSIGFLIVGSGIAIYAWMVSRV